MCPLDRKFFGERNCLYYEYEAFPTIMDLPSSFIIKIKATVQTMLTL